jgi:hypothetical protein
MKWYRFGVLLSVAACGAAGTFLACGESETPGNNNNGSNDASSDSSSNGTDTGTDDPGDSGGEKDAQPDVQKGGATPGKVACGSASCNVPDQTCCLVGDGGTDNCATGTGAACGPALRVRCDDISDCPGADAGDVCCGTASFSLDSGPPPALYYAGASTTCRQKSTCGDNNNEYQYCKTDQECGDKPCVTQVCHKRTVSVCGGVVLKDGGPNPICNP